MLPGQRVGQSSVIRKSRLEGKPSLLPKPRRPGSTDRLSTDNLRPSTTGHRSSSAEPSRGTFGAGRLSREASATKLTGRSRSQTGDARYGQSNPTTTPLRTSHYSRPTTTPVRTPCEDRNNRSWQTSLDRALAFVTVKDQRPISNVAWQRAEYTRVAAALAARWPGALALIRPLTIAKFVEIAAALLAAVHVDCKLNNDNYVTKLPHVGKRLLYPGALSKSWLRTVNTLHAFPHALAFLGYLLDMLAHIETPVLDEWLYLGKDELALLRRDYVNKCWIRFQDPDHQFEDLNEEYLQNLTALLGNDEEKIEKLQQIIKKLEESLEDEAELAARAEEARVRARHESLGVALRGVRAARRRLETDAAAQLALAADRTQLLRAIDADVEKASAELERISAEVEQQPLSVAERTRLLDEVDYLHRVNDSKRALADQVSKMVLSKETELALWQKKTLDCCVEYKQGLIHLSTHFPELSSLAIDEKELMGAECGARVCGAVEALRALATRLAAALAGCARERSALCRHRAALLDETRAKIAKLKTTVEQEQQALDAETAAEAERAARWDAERAELASRRGALERLQEHYTRVETDADFWEKQDLAWRTKLSEMRDYIQSQEEESQRLLEATRNKKIKLLLDNIKLWNEKICQ
ncbi:uncharacterized protein [Epargyreus clarus]|uniref:uncharacterized protein n=1 Tax=Epargyreus clarus TaxID=520877 RepID=UPI003C3093F4